MQVDLIELIKQIVGEIVLEGDSHHLVEKQNALEQFYPILLSALHHKPNLIQHFQQQATPSLTDVFTLAPATEQQFIQSVKGAAPAAEIERTLSQSIAPTLEVLATEAGSNDPTAISHLIAQHIPAIHALLPLGIGGLAGIFTGASAHVTPSIVTPQVAPSAHLSEAEPEQNHTNKWLPWVGLALLLGAGVLLFKGCNPNAPPVATQTQQISVTQPNKLELRTNNSGDLANCQIFSANQPYVATLQQEIKKLFSNSTPCAEFVQADYEQEFKDQTAIANVLQQVKGVPNIHLQWIGDQLSIQGGKASDVEALTSKIRPLLTQMQIKTNTLTDSPASLPHSNASFDETQHVENSIQQAEQALAQINTAQIGASDVAKALNLQIINFATASSDIPQMNQRILAQAAELLKKAPYIQLNIAGHTDSVGDATANQQLSERRAKSVLNYLVKQGVQANQLKAVGYGQTRPVADNQTAEGKFRNRRIEFTVHNTETGSVREVNEQGVQ